MNKSIFIILAIFLVPLAVYWGLTRDKLTTPPAVATNGAEVIKFASPMCYECQELEKVFENQLFEFEIECSAGTYIRSLCRDLSHNTASCGAMLCITRTKCGKFDIKNSFTLDEIKNGKYELLSSFDVVDLPVLSLSTVPVFLTS